MARYIEIDQDKINRLKREAQQFQDDIVCSVGTDFMQKIAEAENRMIFDILKGLEVDSTADVVPKSEVDDLRRYIILNEDIAIKCKRENGVQNEEYWKGKISAFKQIRAYIDAELKKKYTESEGERYKYAERNRCNE